MDSLAIFERGYLFPSPASAAGVESECPFCIARHITNYRSGDRAVMLMGSDSGRLLTYRAQSEGMVVELFEWDDEAGSRLRLMREHWLTLPLEIITVPFWLPNLSLRNCFILDELAVWFRTKCAAGKGFHWQDDWVVEIVRTIWRRRLPVTATELSRVFIAHGLPSMFQSRFEELFDFGMSTLIAAEGRKPLKKFRDELSAGQQLYEIWRQK